MILKLEAVIKSKDVTINNIEKKLLKYKKGNKLLVDEIKKLKGSELHASEVSGRSSSESGDEIDEFISEGENEEMVIDVEECMKEFGFGNYNELASLSESNQND